MANDRQAKDNVLKLVIEAVSASSGGLGMSSVVSSIHASRPEISSTQIFNGVWSLVDRGDIDLTADRKFKVNTL